ncbi:MAG: serine/threonine protein kinase [Polyangiaceae bacterium]|nr:serine/threonine protein kinase [Polyangiaceae bacterium]
MSAVSTPGRIVANKYRLLERIGVGGMSEVYRAEQISTGRVVAVKLLLPHKLEDPAFIARLFQEAHSGLRMNHPGIVQVHEAGQSELGPYLVMDFLLGESAARRLFDHGRFPVPAALSTLLPVLHALQLAHDTGVVHRDIKPGNIFYSVEGPRDVRVKLLDFGVAKVLWPSGAAARTSTGVVMGTPDYLSPEQANGELSIDGRSDVFGAGVVLYELLTGSRPFHAPTAVATAYKVAHQRAPSLKERGGPDDPTLQAIVDRALAKHITERYQSARDLAADLERLVPSTEDRERALLDLVRPEQHLGKQRDATGERPIPTTASPTVPSRPSFPAGWTPPGGAVRAVTSPAANEGRQVRGLALRSIDHYVRQTFGDDARGRVLAQLPSELRRELEYGSMQAIVLYDVELLNRYAAAVTREAAMGNMGWARTAGAHAVGGELGAVLKSALRPGEVTVLLRRIHPALSRLYSFGSWSLEEGHPVSTLRVSDVEPLATAARLWLVGVIEGALAAAGARARSTIARGDIAYAPQLVVDITAS